MSRAHICMVNLPAFGHVLPSLEVIRELVDRGHRVSYAIDPAFADVVTEVGAEFVPCASTLLPYLDGRKALPEDEVEHRDLFLDDSIAMIPLLRAAFDEDRPDLVLYDQGVGAVRVLAESWGVPHVMFAPNSVTEHSDDELVRSFEDMRRDPRLSVHCERWMEWLRANGIESGFLGRPARELALIPRVLQPNPDRVDERRTTFVGPCFGSRATESDWRAPPGRRVLLVSLGSTHTARPEFYRECVAAFGDLPGWHVVLQVGKQVDPAELGELPGTVEVHDWVPQMAVLERADAFLTHAGMGGCVEGLFHGVPMIAVPQDPHSDQPDNADVLVRLGVGVRVDPPAATAATLRRSLLELADDPDVTARLAEIRKELTAGGTTLAADLIEAELPPPPR
ncbi:macrolide family glycosyltransferase [Allokutzneria oryzae]|uniref:Macrolide family glycosyltransferase n=1 Tax=Allokutzneria oryzae TaxID=1378989 RepID=A0ABV5ZXL3_9PSEU